MNFLEILCGVLLLISLGYVAARRFAIPAEICLLVLSLPVSFIPGLTQIHMEPHFIFSICLPPILFTAAYFTSWRDFKFNLRPISLLAFGLVFLTVLGVGLTLKLVMPQIDWAVAFLLGAILAPTDASAAVALIKKFGIPRRLVTILEGESLINDATALIAYKFSLGAAMTGYFTWTGAVQDLVVAGIGGAGIGLALAYAFLWSYKWLKDSRVENIFSLLVAFISYQLAEGVHCSGVIAVVAAGLYFGRKGATIMSAETRLNGDIVWDFIIFLINALVFVMIGLQLPQIIEVMRRDTFVHSSELFIFVPLVVIALRFIFIFPVTYLPRTFSKRLRQRDPAPQKRAVFFLGFLGMRGIVSLAAALALPEVLASGAKFEHRDLLIGLTYEVILVSLLLPTVTLKPLLRWLKIVDDGASDKEETRARLEIARAIRDRLANMESHNDTEAELIGSWMLRYERQIELLEANLQERAFSILYDDDLQKRRLARQLLKVERDNLLKLRRSNVIHDEVFFGIQRELDHEELRLQTLRI